MLSLPRCHNAPAHPHATDAVMYSALSNTRQNRLNRVPSGKWLRLLGVLFIHSYTLENGWDSSVIHSFIHSYTLENGWDDSSLSQGERAEILPSWRCSLALNAHSITLWPDCPCLESGKNSSNSELEVWGSLSLETFRDRGAKSGEIGKGGKWGKVEN